MPLTPEHDVFPLRPVTAPSRANVLPRLCPTIPRTCIRRCLPKTNALYPDEHDAETKTGGQADP